STHFLFAQEDDLKFLSRDHLVRHSFQYHWSNRNYTAFADFLDQLKSRKAKQVRKERRAVEDLRITWRSGDELGEAQGKTFYRYYLSTVQKKGGIPYLTEAFFELVFERMKDRILLVTAARDGVELAQALFF